MLMTPVVLQHVRKTRPRLAGRGELVQVVPIREHRPFAMEQVIQALRDADREPLHSAPERLRVVSLDDQVEMVVLHGEVDDPKIFSNARSSADRLFDLREGLLCAEVTDRSHGP
jgi:hypothetical protein